jgi:hypothetical protein
MGRNEVSTSVVEWSVVGGSVLKWSDDLSNRLSTIIWRYTDHVKFTAYIYGCFVYHILSYSFGSILYNSVYGFMFCMLLFNFVNYVLLLLC